MMADVLDAAISGSLRICKPEIHTSPIGKFPREEDPAVGILLRTSPESPRGLLGGTGKVVHPVVYPPASGGGFE